MNAMGTTVSHPAEQLAALPWRRRDGVFEVLMVTSRLSGHWLIPKGWPMEGKTAPEAALQEAWEEAGLRGEASSEPVGSYCYEKLRRDGTTVGCTVSVFAMQVSEELDDWKECGARRRQWFDLNEAAQRAYEPGLRALLEKLRAENVMAATSAAA